MYGRLPVYHTCNILFVIWNLACTVAPTSSIGALLVFRLFAGIAGSCPVTIFAGSIADVFKQEQRGGAMAICAMGPLIGMYSRSLSRLPSFLWSSPPRVDTDFQSHRPCCWPRSRWLSRSSSRLEMGFRCDHDRLGCYGNRLDHLPERNVRACIACSTDGQAQERNKQPQSKIEAR